MANSKNRFGEVTSLELLKAHIDGTYGEHYAKGEIQALDIMIDDDDIKGFARGSAIKYLRRYGKKGGCNTQDLLKAAHLILVLHAQEVKRLADNKREATNE